jgi:hypothetical protein
MPRVNSFIAIKISPELKARIVERARLDKRTFASEAEYLMERQLDELEGVNAIQGRELAGFMAGGKVS